MAAIAVAGHNLRFIGWVDGAGVAGGNLGATGLALKRADCAVGLFIFTSNCSSVTVMRVGQLSALTLFRYTSLLWVLLLGWLVFDEWPTALTSLGVVIVAATGLYNLYRESKISQLG